MPAMTATWRPAVMAPVTHVPDGSGSQSHAAEPGQRSAVYAIAAVT
jgi:hypothetical protein